MIFKDPTQAILWLQSYASTTYLVAWPEAETLENPILRMKSKQDFVCALCKLHNTSCLLSTDYACVRSRTLDLHHKGF